MGRSFNTIFIHIRSPKLPIVNTRFGVWFLQRRAIAGMHPSFFGQRVAPNDLFAIRRRQAEITGHRQFFRSATARKLAGRLFSDPTSSGPAPRSEGPARSLAPSNLWLQVLVHTLCQPSDRWSISHGDVADGRPLQMIVYSFFLSLPLLPMIVLCTDRHGIRFRSFRSPVIETRSEPVLNRPGYTLENGSGCLTIGVHLSGPLCQRG